MLGKNTYTQDYIDQCRANIDQQLTTYKNLHSTARKQAGNAEAVNTAIAAFEPVFFNNMLLVLDNLFVHRLRKMEGKDGNPLNEVRLLCESLLLNDGKLLADKQIKLDPETSILHYAVGDAIRVNEADFTRLAAAFFAEIESKFAEQAVVTE